MTGERLARRALQLGLVVILGGAWYFATVTGRVNVMLLPPVPAVWTEFLALLKSGRYIPDLEVTLYELAVAFAIAAISGSVIGYIVSRSRYATRIFDPLFAGLYSIPAILLFPLYVLFFGLGPPSKIAIGATIGFFPVVLNTIAGLAYVDRSYTTAARSMGASHVQMFWSVMLPAAFPVVLTGLRMGFITGFLSILGAETIASLSGLGHQIVSLAENMDTAKMFAYIIFVILIAIVLNGIVSWVEARGRRAPG